MNSELILYEGGQIYTCLDTENLNSEKCNDIVNCFDNLRDFYTNNRKLFNVHNYHDYEKPFRNRAYQPLIDKIQSNGPITTYCRNYN